MRAHDADTPLPRSSARPQLAIKYSLAGNDGNISENMAAALLK